MGEPWSDFKTIAYALSGIFLCLAYFTATDIYSKVKSLREYHRWTSLRYSERPKK